MYLDDAPTKCIYVRDLLNLVIFSHSYVTLKVDFEIQINHCLSK